MMNEFIAKALEGRLRTVEHEKQKWGSASQQGWPLPLTADPNTATK